MRRVPRIFLVALLVVFATSVAAHAMAGTSMSIEMAMSGGITGDASGCDFCGPGGAGDEKSGPVCEMVCNTSFVSVVSIECTPVFLSRGTTTVEYVGNLLGRTGSLDPDPPRTLTLN